VKNKSQTGKQTSNNRYEQTTLIDTNSPTVINTVISPSISVSKSDLQFTTVGHHEIKFYSGDKGGNVEDVKTETFDIIM